MVAFVSIQVYGRDKGGTLLSTLRFCTEFVWMSSSVFDSNVDTITIRVSFKIAFGIFNGFLSTNLFITFYYYFNIIIFCEIRFFYHFKKFVDYQNYEIQAFFFFLQKFS